MKVFFCALITAALLGVTGCTSAGSDRVRYNRIAENLDTGGSCYFISTSSSAANTVARVIKEGEKYTWNAPLPPETKFKLQHAISNAELLARVAGLHEIQGWGGSSKQLPGKGVMYRNKFRLLLPAEAKGAFWNILSKENLPLEKELYDLPDDTYFAGVFNLSPGALLRFIDSDKKFSGPANNICKVLTGKPPAEVAKHLSGIWKVVLVCDEDNEISSLTGIHLALTVPDKGNLLFKTLSSRMKAIPETVVDDKSIKLAPVPGQMCIPYAVRGVDRLTICTSPRAFLRSSQINSFPRRPACIKKLSHIPELYGTALVYGRDLNCLTPAKKIDMSRVEPTFAVVRKVSDGFFVDGVSSCDLNSVALLSAAAVPVNLAFDLLSAPPKKKRTSPAAPPQAAAPKKPAKVSKAAVAANLRKATCASAVSKAGKALLGAVEKSKKWPAPGIAGLRFLAEQKLLSPALLKCPAVRARKASTQELNYGNCHYIYLGKPGQNSPKTPLLMEIPFLHKDHFSVFYADGSVEEIKLSGRRNVRRAVSYLHTIHSYEEEEFIRLIQFATELDKILEP